MTTRADLSASLVGALGPLVAGRVHARMFPLEISGAVPTWPAIRYAVISSTPTIDINGGGPTDEADDIRIQVDIVSDATKPETAHLALVAAVRAALDVLGPHWVIESERGLADDAELRVHAESLDVIVCLSTPGA